MQVRQRVAVSWHVKHEESQGLQILSKLLKYPELQEETQIFVVIFSEAKDESHDVQLVEVPKHVLQLELQILHLLSAESTKYPSIHSSHIFDPLFKFLPR